MTASEEPGKRRASISFTTVMRMELESTERRRQALREKNELPKPVSASPIDGDVLRKAIKDITDEKTLLAVLEKQALAADLCGLAISGGGIRSATFGLGVLQGLAAAKLLPRFDYLSTVSGGGYIGSWYTAWINREGFCSVAEQLLPPRLQRGQSHAEVEPEAIRHLRLYSNYLAPRPGLFTFDGWVLLSISVRNLILNQLVLLLAILGFFLGVRTIVEIYSFAHLYRSSNWLRLLMAVTMVVVAVVGTARYTPAADQKVKAFKLQNFWLTCIIPWLLSAISLSLLFVSLEAHTWFVAEWVIDLFITMFIFGVLHLLLGGASLSCSGRGLLAGGLAGALGGALLFGAWKYLYLSAESLNVTVAAAATFGVPISLVVFVLTNFLQIGICGPASKELEREWWSSLNSRLLMIATGWLALFSVSIYGPWLFGVWLNASASWYATITNAAGLSWVTALLAGLKASQGSGTSTVRRGGLWEYLAQATPVLFLLSLIFAISVSTTWIAYDVYASQFQDGDQFTFLRQTDRLLVELQDPVNRMPVQVLGYKLPLPVFPLLILSTLGLLLCSHRLGVAVGVNTFTLHNLYANRLVRCYLGASKKNRIPDPLVNMDEGDDLHISKLFPGSKYTFDDALEPHELAGEIGKEYWGPIHLLNGALNQKASAIRSRGSRSQADASSSEELRAEKLQFVERQAESFIFSPLYCGSEATGYCPSLKFAGDIKLGTAIAVSGAAVSPNMGYHSSPAITALLTLFNVRLGAWFGNPRCAKTRADRNPSASAWLLLSELAGITDAESDHVYVSDGGHFENMGVYELIRRRCRFILAIDAGADPKFHENVGRVVRQVRIDFGIRIDIDMAPVTPGENGRSQAHVVVGRIHYGDVIHESAEPDASQWGTESPNDPRFDPAKHHGIIVWIKNSLTGDEPGDIANYAAMNPSFPYDSTADQFFSESQFESYRTLGLHATLQSIVMPWPEKKAIDSAERIIGAAQVTSPVRASKSQVNETSTRDIFQSIYEFWLTKPEQFLSGYIRENEAYAKIQAALRGNERLHRLAVELYGTQQERVKEREAKYEVEERLMINEMFTLLENVFFELDLERRQFHPVHAGWMGVFKNWTSSKSFRKHWEDEKASTNGLKREFSPAFCRFIDNLMASK